MFLVKISYKSHFFCKIWRAEMKCNLLCCLFCLLSEVQWRCFSNTHITYLWLTLLAWDSIHAFRCSNLIWSFLGSLIPRPGVCYVLWQRMPAPCMENSQTQELRERQLACVVFLYPSEFPLSSVFFLSACPVDIKLNIRYKHNSFQRQLCKIKYM